MKVFRDSLLGLPPTRPGVQYKQTCKTDTLVDFPEFDIDNRRDEGFQSNKVLELVAYTVYKRRLLYVCLVSTLIFAGIVAMRLTVNIEPDDDELELANGYLAVSRVNLLAPKSTNASLLEYGSDNNETCAGCRINTTASHLQINDTFREYQHKTNPQGNSSVQRVTPTPSIQQPTAQTLSEEKTAYRVRGKVKIVGNETVQLTEMNNGTTTTVNSVPKSDVADKENVTSSTIGEQRGELDIELATRESANHIPPETELTETNTSVNSSSTDASSLTSTVETRSSNSYNRDAITKTLKELISSESSTMPSEIPSESISSTTRQRFASELITNDGNLKSTTTDTERASRGDSSTESTVTTTLSISSYNKIVTETEIQTAADGNSPRPV